MKIGIIKEYREENGLGWNEEYADALKNDPEFLDYEFRGAFMATSSNQ